MLTFGFTLKLDWTPEQVIDLTKSAEANGFEYGWVFDSHVLWLEPFPMLTLMATHSQKLRLGCCVTNPTVRDATVAASLHATLNVISGNRMVLGIGRGDSSRRVLGKKPATMAYLEEATLAIRDLVAGQEVSWEGSPVKLSWSKSPLPIWIAGYGPKVLHMAGRIADGVILQFADPALIKWCLQFLHEGAKAAGRDPKSIAVMAAAPAFVSNDLAHARDQVRWFPALVSNHVMDLLGKYPKDELPPELTAYVHDRKGYDYHEHAEVGAKHASFVADDVVDRFCVIGPPDRILKRLRELEEVGVTQFNIYLMSGEEPETLQTFGRDIIPACRAKSAV
ncbi:MAG TPA: TIGR03842 family LLM class F420-dependent oxidoreductase [Candidatus Xenobia bacterium]|jgi:probable F420-dependent oxidoreductase